MYCPYSLGKLIEWKLSDLTTVEIKHQHDWYLNFEQRVLEAYKLVDLIYDAEENPFIC